MKICQSRKSTHTIMSHGGFGKLKVIHRGVEIKIPETFMFNDGRLKSYAVKWINKEVQKINEFLDRKDAC